MILSRNTFLECLEVLNIFVCINLQRLLVELQKTCPVPQSISHCQSLASFSIGLYASACTEFDQMASRPTVIHADPSLVGHQLSCQVGWMQAFLIDVYNLRKS